MPQIQQQNQGSNKIWFFFQLEMLLFSALMYGIYHSRAGSQLGYNILFLGLVGYILFHSISPFKKQEQMEVHWSWVSLWSLSLILISSAYLLQWLKWDGSRLLLIGGLVLASVAHLLLAIIASIRKQPLSLQKILFWGLWLCISICLTGWFCYRMAWPNALIISMLGMSLGMLLLLFFVFKMFINWEEYHYLLFYVPRLAWASLLATAVL